MGDFFHQTNANQSSANSQAAASTRDVTGGFVNAGSGSLTAGTGGTVLASGARLDVQNLDPAALAVAAQAIHDSSQAQTATATAAFEGYQHALDISAETASHALAATPGGQSAATALGINPSAVIWGVVAVVGLVLIAGAFRK